MGRELAVRREPFSVVHVPLFTAAMEVYDPDLGGHATRVGRHARTLAERMGWSDEALQRLELGSALHDVGKLNIRPGVLTKPTRLEPSELALVRAHPVEGTWLIAGVPSLAAALPYVLFHHERWDGRGYPTRRAGSDIPIEGRLLAVADAFDAMTSARPYKQSLELDEAVGEVEKYAGTQFDPDIAAVLVDAVTDGAFDDLVLAGATSATV